MNDHKGSVVSTKEAIFNLSKISASSYHVVRVIIVDVIAERASGPNSSRVYGGANPRRGWSDSTR